MDGAPLAQELGKKAMRGPPARMNVAPAPEMYGWATRRG